jgi:hypothetical protein
MNAFSSNTTINIGARSNLFRSFLSDFGLGSGGRKDRFLSWDPDYRVLSVSDVLTYVMPESMGLLNCNYETYDPRHKRKFVSDRWLGTEMLLGYSVSSQLTPWLIAPYFLRAYFLPSVLRESCPNWKMRSSETRTESRVTSQLGQFGSIRLRRRKCRLKWVARFSYFGYAREQGVRRERVWISVSALKDGWEEEEA